LAPVTRTQFEKPHITICYSRTADEMRPLQHCDAAE